MGILYGIHDVLFMAYWSLRGQKWEAVWLTMYRRARRDGISDDDAGDLATRYVQEARRHER
jgi:hypothetical protein